MGCQSLEIIFSYQRYTNFNSGEYIYIYKTVQIVYNTSIIQMGSRKKSGLYPKVSAMSLCTLFLLIVITVDFRKICLTVSCKNVVVQRFYNKLLIKCETPREWR